MPRNQKKTKTLAQILQSASMRALKKVKTPTGRLTNLADLASERQSADYKQATFDFGPVASFAVVHVDEYDEFARDVKGNMTALAIVRPKDIDCHEQLLENMKESKLDRDEIYYDLPLLDVVQKISYDELWKGAQDNPEMSLNDFLDVQYMQGLMKL